MATNLQCQTTASEVDSCSTCMQHAAQSDQIKSLSCSMNCVGVGTCSNAFVSQVGRTARQGLSGDVTSLYSPDRQHLAEAVKNAIEADEPIEGAFSRNRSFAKKFRKYGQYVPRGQTLAVSQDLHC